MIDTILGLPNYFTTYWFWIGLVLSSVFGFAFAAFYMDSENDWDE